MSYTHRLATLEDTNAIASLMAAFNQERAAIDPTRTLKPDFDFEQYVRDHLTKPLHYYWVLEYSNDKSPEPTTIVGFLLAYVQDEAPPEDMPADLAQQHNRSRPYQPRRVGNALGFYLFPKHRKTKPIKQLIDAGIQQAQELKVSDLDLQVAAEQKGMQALLERAGFTKTFIQYTKHFPLATDTEIPSLHPPHPKLEQLETPQLGAIPLRHPQTNEIITNPQGKPVFLTPVQDNGEELLKTSEGLPIYQTPIRHPQTQDFVFDTKGELVVCPVLRDEKGYVVENKGIPQFHPPAYQVVQGKLQLKQDEAGNYVFCEVERDQDGKILKSTDGKPVFKQPLD